MQATAPAPAAAAATPKQYRFAVGARERFAGTFYDESVTLTTSTQTLPMVSIAAGDFTAGVYLYVQATTAGNAAATAYKADGPFSVLQQVELLDPQGMSFQVYSGYELMILNALGGWTGQSIQANGPSYSATTGAGATGGSFAFYLRIPCELFPRDGAASLFNGSTAAQFKVRITLAASTDVYSTAPTNQPTVRVRVNSHGYQVPNVSMSNGVGVATQPPGGQIYQNIYRQVEDWSGSGTKIIPLDRKGFLYRTLTFIVRDNTNARSNSILNSDWRVTIDNVDVFNGDASLLRQITWERNRYYLGTDLPAGIYQLSWAFDLDGLNGGESRDQYPATQPGSIVTLQATAAAAGNVTILTNDVSPTAEALAMGVLKA